MRFTRGNPNLNDPIHFRVLKAHPDHPGTGYHTNEPYCGYGSWHVRMIDSWHEVTCEACLARKDAALEVIADATLRQL